jgi:2-hydroxychromene-2-carboxylate isomerase
MKTKAYFYYDLISPFTYFFLKSKGILQERLELIPVPIFAAGLFRLQNNRGPAEVAQKRDYTYQFCVWKAQQLKIPFQFPPRHPFASAPAQRLLLQIGADLETLERAFDFVWANGNDPELQWEAFCVAIGLDKSTPKPNDDTVKQALIDSTQAASEQGVFGVPSLRIESQVFWGSDSIDWILAYLENPSMFDEPAFKKALSTINPLKN